MCSCFTLKISFPWQRNILITAIESKIEIFFFMEHKQVQNDVMWVFLTTKPEFPILWFICISKEAFGQLCVHRPSLSFPFIQNPGENGLKSVVGGLGFQQRHSTVRVINDSLIQVIQVIQVSAWGWSWSFNPVDHCFIAKTLWKTWGKFTAGQDRWIILN